MSQKVESVLNAVRAEVADAIASYKKRNVYKKDGKDAFHVPPDVFIEKLVRAAFDSDALIAALVDEASEAGAAKK